MSESIMKLDVFNTEASKIWRRLSDGGQETTDLLQFEVDFYKKFLIFFQIGESCYFIFNFQQVQLDFVSNETAALLGYDKEEISVNFIMENIHFQDRAWFLSCQETAGRFIMNLPWEKQLKYKMRFDYRLKRKSGEYIRIMQQVVVIQNDDTGKILRTLIVLTDITHLKENGRPVMSYIGMGGEPSYLDVDVQDHFTEENNLLTRREKEILFYLAEGKLSKQIADLLNISKHTVDSHRKNILRKMEVANAGELVKKAIWEGLI